MYTLGSSASEQLKVLRDVSLPELAYVELQNLIMSGDIMPGERINESQISEQLGINRAPIREACRQLQQEGLVEITKNKGAFLRDIPVEEAADLYDVRASLEALAAQNAATLWRDIDLDTLRACVDQMRDAADRKNNKELYALAAEFHRVITEMSGNKHLIDMIQSVSRKISVFRFKLSDTADATPTCDDEVAIFKAIEERNSEVAGQLMQAHVRKGKMRVLRNFVSQAERK